MCIYNWGASGLLGGGGVGLNPKLIECPDLVLPECGV